MGKAVRVEEVRNAYEILLWKFQGKRNYLGNLAQRGGWHSTGCYTIRG
jgi:hypothetical protein